MKKSLQNVATVAFIFAVTVCVATIVLYAILWRTGPAAANTCLLAGLAIALASTSWATTHWELKAEFDSFLTVLMKTTALLSAITALVGMTSLSVSFAVPATAVLGSIAILRKVVSDVNFGLAFLTGGFKRCKAPEFCTVEKFFGVLFLSGISLTAIQAMPMVIAVRNGVSATLTGSIGFVIAFCGALAITCKVCEGEEYEPIKGLFFGISMPTCGYLAAYAPMLLCLVGLDVPLLGEILAAYSIASAIIGFVRMLAKDEIRKVQLFSAPSAWQSAWMGLRRMSRTS